MYVSQEEVCASMAEAIFYSSNPTTGAHGPHTLAYGLCLAIVGLCLAKPLNIQAAQGEPNMGD